jgi:ABC-2 type transport system permease protein
MSNFFRGIIRASSFFRKEIFEILRQPRLVATLVLGPFLILFIFGIGYRDQPRTLRTLFVATEKSAIPAKDIQQYGKTVSEMVAFSGVTANVNDALNQLHRGQVDLVIVVPDDAEATIKANQQATFTLYHQEIDPSQVSYVDYLGWLYVGQVNQQVLRTFAEQGQKEAAGLQTNLKEAHTNVSALRQAVQAGDEVLAQQKQQALSGNVDAVTAAVGASLSLLRGLQQAQNGSDGASASPSVQDTINDLNQNTTQTGSTVNKDERLARIDKIDQELTDLDKKLAEFQSVDPYIIVSPFRNETKSVASTQPTVTDFFGPAVLALLLQHLAVTFAALSIVRERNVGTMELFRVSPLSAGEALFGKYVSYLLFGGVIAVVLALLLVFGLHMPMLGNWLFFALAVAGVLFTSLGIGFAISIVSQTDSQAVQYSMILLLASVFFSGFIMSLTLLWPPVRVLSWLLPTTYGTSMLRDIALRGINPNWLQMGGLFALGLVFLVVSWLLMRRLIASPQ